MAVPRLTVGIPFHNEEERLAAAVRSILGQTFGDLELLLIDDGSTDRSLAIARAFDDPRIIVTSDGQRRHLPARLNEIVRRARGDLVARMDADDVSHPRRLAVELEVLARDPACDAVGTWVAYVGDDGEILAVTEASPCSTSPRLALEQGILPHATMVARRRWLREHPYDEVLTRTEDRDLWCRTAQTSRFAVVAEPLYVIHVSPRDATFLASYVESQAQNRALLRRHGPVAVGRARTARLVASSHLKALAMRAACGVGAADRLVRRRGRPPSAEERALILEALQL